MQKKQGKQHMKDQPARNAIPIEHHQVIQMAWCDKTSFDAIKAQTGLPEKAVIKIMRTYLKPSSFRMWRKRVTGRKSKHAKT